MLKGWRRAMRSNCSGSAPRCVWTSSAIVGRDSGDGTVRAGGSWCSKLPGSGLWKEAVRVKIVRPCCTAVTRRVVKDLPSRTRSTWYTIGTPGRPGRRKYACSECTGRSPSVVRPAATRAWPATWPPKTRWRDSCGLRPRKMLTSICSRSSRSTSLSAGFVIGAVLLCSQLSDVGDTDDGTALFVGGHEVYLGGDAPVVVAVGVGEGLTDAPQPVLRLLH